ncbi:acyl--CoA ligase [Halobacteria archaeon AArc-m2/3/4]|uniref:Acyl--CoA ligase n=1 Tax=Natronoglomus mannanivorans TaxID=2979990 RepID=A0ABT2QAS0_9EURY|nr:acyl--CoA ligase [Halobacteria archaeon AArc-m2/3/4]
MANVVDGIRTPVMQRPAGAAITDTDDETTYAEFWKSCDRFAGAIRDREYTQGDRIAVWLPDGRDLLVTAVGTLRNGGTIVLLPAHYDGETVVDVLEGTGTTALVTTADRVASNLSRLTSSSLRLLVTTDGEATVGLGFEKLLDNDGLYSSGSRTGIEVIKRGPDAVAMLAYPATVDGDPFSVTYTHGAITRTMLGVGKLLESTGSPRTQLGVLPLSHPTGFVLDALATLLAGGEYEVTRRWDVERVQSRLEERSIDRLYLTSGMDTELLADGGSIEPTETTVGIVHTVHDGRPKSLENGDEWDVFRLFSSPMTGVTHVRGPDEDRTLGQPLPGVDTRVVDTVTETDAFEPVAAGERGTLAVSGPTVPTPVDDTQLANEWTYRADGKRWLRTGLEVRVEDGRHYLTDTESPPTSP